MQHVTVFFLLAAGFVFNAYVVSKSHKQSSPVQHTVISDLPVLPLMEINNKIALNQLTAGVMMLNQNAKGIIKLYDQNNKVSGSIDLSGELDASISPYSGFLEYEILVFRVVQSDSFYHHVIVNEQTGLTGKIKKSEPLLKYQKWSEHVMNVFSVDFDAMKNPLRKDTVQGSKSVYDNNVEFYHPSAMNGDWLKLKWDTDKGQRYGWIRWKKGNTLLVDLNYIP